MVSLQADHADRLFSDRQLATEAFVGHIEDMYTAHSLLAKSRGMSALCPLTSLLSVLNIYGQQSAGKVN